MAAKWDDFISMPFLHHCTYAEISSFCFQSDQVFTCTINWLELEVLIYTSWWYLLYYLLFIYDLIIIIISNKLLLINQNQQNSKLKGLDTQQIVKGNVLNCHAKTSNNPKIRVVFFMPFPP